jgi:hypothetical protein
MLSSGSYKNASKRTSSTFGLSQPIQLRLHCRSVLRVVPLFASLFDLSRESPLRGLS